MRSAVGDNLTERFVDDYEIPVTVEKGARMNVSHQRTPCASGLVLSLSPTCLRWRTEMLLGEQSAK